MLSPLALRQLSGEMVTDGLPLSRIGSALNSVSVRGLLIQLRILRQLRFRQQRLRLRTVLLTELVPRLTVDVIHFQREFAAARHPAA